MTWKSLLTGGCLLLNESSAVMKVSFLLYIHVAIGNHLSEKPNIRGAIQKFVDKLKEMKKGNKQCLCDTPRIVMVNKDQRTNGPVNAHLISGPRISTKYTKP